MGDDAESSEMDEEGAWGSATRLGHTEPHSLSSRNTSDMLGRSGAAAHHAPLMPFSFLLFARLAVTLYLRCAKPQILRQEQKFHKPVYL